MEQVQPVGRRWIARPLRSVGTVSPAPLRVPAWAWLVAFAALTLVYVVALDNGLLLGRFGAAAHEVFHNTRHFASVPCH